VAFFQNLGAKFEHMDPDPAAQFNADPDPQPGGEGHYPAYEKLEKQKKAKVLGPFLQSFFRIIYGHHHWLIARRLKRVFFLSNNPVLAFLSCRNM
jgi:hypothetical protein